MGTKKTKTLKATATRVQPVRHSRVVCLVSDEEMKIINDYLKKYKIANKSNWMRKTLLTAIYKSIDADYPTLFSEHEMNR
ncbi:MAG: hypothetical protein IKB11_06675 [Bacteroidaceae bacterium]|nr:hypothetical protein [Bacteroidaceae bacterium]MBR1946661.1 hypothetical protein [Bacteroidaceae bacterium]MBR2416422.1 hypothetical protein [Bacteroidaceae bacterium]